MTRDQVIQMAREASPFGEDSRLYFLAEVTPEVIERFAAIAYAQGQRDMREAAAGCVENANTPDCGGWDASGIAEAIRAIPIKEVK